MGCTAEAAAAHDAEKAYEKARVAYLGAKEALKTAVAAPIDGILEMAEGFFGTKNPAKATKGARHALSASSDVFEADRQAKATADDFVTTGNEMVRTSAALNACLAKEKNKKRPKKQKQKAVPGPWKGYVKCIIRVVGVPHQFGSWHEDSFEQQVEQTWTITNEPQNPNDVDEYPARWAYTVAGSEQQTQQSKPIDVLTTTFSGSGDRKSNLTIHVDGDRYKIQSPLRPDFVTFEWHTRSSRFGERPVQSVPSLMAEPVELTGRVAVVNVAGDPSSEEHLIVGRDDPPLEIPSRGGANEKWTRAFSWEFRR